MIIAKHRHFHNVAKVNANHRMGERSDLTQNELRCHSILFKHDAPVTASIALMFFKWLDQYNSSTASSPQNKEPGILRDLMTKLLTVQLVGPELEIETIGRKAKMQTHIQARAYVVYQWIAVLQHVHPLYQNDPRLEISHYSSFRSFVQECNCAILDRTVALTSQSVRDAEKVSGDDVAQVRTAILSKSDLHNIKASATVHPQASGMNVSYSFVANSNPAGADFHEQNQQNTDHNSQQCQQNLSILLEIANVFNVQLPDKDASDEVPSPKARQQSKDSPSTKGTANDPADFLHVANSAWNSKRDDDPINEFTDMHDLLVGAFPQIFLFGTSYKTKQTLPSSLELEHLLLQYTNVPATSRELLFYLFDCKSRHRVLQNISARIKKDPKAFEDYARLVRSEDFQAKIIQASKKPSSPVAKEVLRTVLPILNFGTRNGAIGGLGDTTSLSRAIAHAQRYGDATTMVTITPDDINCPPTLRLAVRNVDNTTFPATVDDTFFEKLMEGSTEVSPKGSIKIPLSYTHRKKASVENPVAVAFQFRAMMENILTILFGCPVDVQPGTNSKKVTTWFFKATASNCPHHKGIFGEVRSFFGCIETQARGALHFHILLWGGLEPKLLQSAAYIPELCAQVEKALDSIYKAEIPLSMHVKDIIVRKMKHTPHGPQMLPKTSKAYPAMKHAPSILKSKQQWRQFFWDNVLKTGIHEHTFTCKKPPQGFHHCRTGKPSGSSQKTQPVFLED